MSAFTIYLINQLCNSFCRVGIKINTMVGTAIKVMMSVRKGNGSIKINCLPNNVNIRVMSG
jgi:hypothetical protein